MKKAAHITAIASIIICILTMLTVNSSAAVVANSGTCGDGLEWEYYDDYVLKIIGAGAIYDHTYSSPPQWWPYIASEAKAIIINEGVDSIGNHAFFSFPDLTSVVIPDSVESIGDYAFWACGSLTSIAVPDSVVSIGLYAFLDFDSLMSIKLSAGITSISIGTFKGCSSLTDITLPDNVESIGELAFMDCTSLTSITLPDSVASIGENAFAGCDGLTDVYYAGTQEQWENISIDSGNDLLMNAVIHFNGVSEKTVAEQLFETILSNTAAPYIPELDINNDGIIDIRDLIEYVKSDVCQ